MYDTNKTISKLNLPRTTKQQTKFKSKRRTKTRSNPKQRNYGNKTKDQKIKDIHVQLYSCTLATTNNNNNKPDHIIYTRLTFVYYTTIHYLFTFIKPHVMLCQSVFFYIDFECICRDVVRCLTMNVLGYLVFTVCCIILLIFGAFLGSC